jgi:hypothetical protein
MQRYNVAASSSPAATKPNHVADYAASDEESLMRWTKLENLGNK